MPFDAKSFLTNHGIPQAPANHRHHRRGWVNVRCPWCSGNPGYHLGFNTDGGYATCYRCGFHWTPKAVAALLKISIPKAKDLIQPYLTGEQIREFKERHYVDNIQYPPDTGPMNNKQRRYLEERNFDPEQLETEWELKGVGRYGMYKGRILAPIRLHGELISYQTRDVTDEAAAKYMACADNEEVYHHGYTLYGIDKCNSKRVVVVEGVTDTWRLGAGVVGCFGIEYTPQQVLMLGKKFDLVFPFFDSEDQAQEKAEQLSYDLMEFNTECQILIPLIGDPGSMPQDEADALMRELGL